MKNIYFIRGEITAIVLNRQDGSTLETLIDTVDLEKAKSFPNTWCAAKYPSSDALYCYGAIRHDGKQTNIKLHRWLTGCGPALLVDHYDNNPLNNTRSNLRLVNHSGNLQNRTGPCKNNTCGVRGVWWSKRKSRWVAEAKVDKRTVYCSLFVNLEDATRAVEEARRTLMPYSKEAS